MHAKAAFALLPFMLTLTPAAWSHYLWVSADQLKGEGQVVNLCFEEAPAPGDGHYLDHFIGSSSTTIRTLTHPKPKEIILTELKQKDKRWLQSPLTQTHPKSIDSYGKFGVYAYGKTKVLLHYYARHLDVRSHEALHELGRAEHMNLDLVPHDSEDEVELTLLWKGKPIAERMVFIRGPGGFKKNISTDALGHVTFSPEKDGRYRFRSSVEESIPGEEDGEKYDFIRHNITLLMDLPLEQ